MPQDDGLSQTEEGESARLSAPAARDRTEVFQYPSPPDGSTPPAPKFAGRAPVASRRASKTASNRHGDDGQTSQTVLLSNGEKFIRRAQKARTTAERI